ncbi:IQ domain-containing protein E [Trichostrongylus colubriformis]|uniref:IQ domain-containing protein E n=1 Tax=Trichostrongylus colubriformis TaxID=6319 RepID=A0AAN8FSL3_TRICO
MESKVSAPLPLKSRQLYKLVLTGGPCGGKSTGQDRLATFFENMGWKVFTVPETATILFGGRVKFEELNPEQAYLFQKDLLKTMLQIEDVFFNQAEATLDRNILVICDRGGMDPSAYMGRDEWFQMLHEIGVEEFDLLNKRYDQVVHLVTAADGAEEYYTLANNVTRKETLSAAKEMDVKTRKAWLGHPYLDIIDNSECRKFEDKVLKLIQVVCDRTGIDPQDRLSKNSRKRKWLVRSIDESRFVKYEQFNILHEYLLSDNPETQVRIRSREQNGRSTFTVTRRELHRGKEFVETRTQITFREYTRYRTMKDRSRAPLHKQRRCFMVGNQYFNLDLYTVIPPSANSLQLDGHLIFLETYTTVPKGEPVLLPDFLEIEKEITGQAAYSMYSMAKIPNSDRETDEFVGAAECLDD